VGNEDESDWKEKKSNQFLAKGNQHAFNLKHGFIESEKYIGGFYKYDHKITFAIGVLFSSLATLLQESIFSYAYFLFLIKIIRDTFGSGVIDSNFRPSEIIKKPLIYYIVAGSIIVVAAQTAHITVPGFESQLTTYIGSIT